MGGLFSRVKIAHRLYAGFATIVLLLVGAVAVSLIAVALLLLGWLGMYFLVFLPRGTVG